MNPNIALIMYQNSENESTLFFQILHGRVLYVDMEPPDKHKKSISEGATDSWCSILCKQSDTQGKTAPWLQVLLVDMFILFSQYNI